MNTHQNSRTCLSVEMGIRPDEVEVTQYMRPHGRTEKVYAPVGFPHVEKVNTCGHMVLSAENLMNGMVAIYGRLQDDPPEDELTELAVNGPGENTPTHALQRVIDKLYERWHAKGLAQ